MSTVDQRQRRRMSHASLEQIGEGGEAVYVVRRYYDNSSQDEVCRTHDRAEAEAYYKSIEKER